MEIMSSRERRRRSSDATKLRLLAEAVSSVFATEQTMPGAAERGLSRLVARYPGKRFLFFLSPPNPP